jgi:hypothetical protein
MGSFSFLAQGNRSATAVTALAAAPRTSAVAASRREGFAAGFLVRDRVAAARAAVLRLATEATRFDAAFLVGGRVADDRFNDRCDDCLRATARFAK